MDSLLDELRSRYVTANPDVKILVLGYYNVLSNFSIMPSIYDVVKVLAQETIAPPKPTTTAEAYTLHTKSLSIRDTLIRNSLAFRDASRSDLSAAIAGANAKSGRATFYFIDPLISDEEAAFAPNALIWGLNQKEKPEDPLSNDRLAYCGNLLKKHPGIDRFTCDRASLGHPNIKGAQRYAQTIFTFLAGSERVLPSPPTPMPTMPPASVPSPTPSATPV